MVRTMGAPSSQVRRDELPTPALVVELAAFEHNLAAAQRLVDAHGVGLRPHAKTHKCAEIAARQLTLGARGICVAKLGEAEALAAAGIDRLLVTTPIHPAWTQRVAALAATGVDLTVVVDSPTGVAAVPAAPALGVLVDVDVGLHRTGVTSPVVASELARLLGGRLRGVQGYGGHWQHISDPHERRDAVAEGMRLLTECIEAIEAAGRSVDLRTGGGTGSLPHDLELGVLNDLQLGSYVFMDREYADALASDEVPWRQALFVDTTVISANHDAFVTVDAGLKAMATDAGPPVVAGHPERRYHWFGDEHGLVTGAATVGDRLSLIPPHCDPTVDRYDVVHVVDGDSVVDVWPITARGHSQ
jgi:D-serine deaminase-like pyridoxal phosphate-dependent protein